MAAKNIIIAPCGNKSQLFEFSWLKQKDQKEFELCLLFYHDEILEPEKYKKADHFFHLRGFKYHMIHQLLTEIHPEWLDQYEYFYFLDDDIDIDTISINRLFALSRAFQSDISCAALSPDSYCSWPIFKQKSNSFCRFVGQIEVMAPLFDRNALKTCLPSFIANKSSWGIDSVWSRLLNYPEKSLIVFDQVIMRHTAPVGGGELYKKIGTDPHEEWEAVTRQFQARKHNYKECGRLVYVNRKKNILGHAYFKFRELINRQAKAWNDYDLPSRVKSRSKRLFR